MADRFFAPPIGPEDLYLQDKRKRKYDDKLTPEEREIVRNTLREKGYSEGAIAHILIDDRRRAHVPNIPAIEEGD
jgi:hypothetical protein